MKDGNTNLKLIATNKDLVDEPTPIIIISGEQQKLGIINNINVSAASLFGYSRLELLSNFLEIYHSNSLKRSTIRSINANNICKTS